MINDLLRAHGLNGGTAAGGIGDFLGDGSDGAFNPNLASMTTAPNGGTVANLWDMNNATVFTTGNLPAAADQVIFSIDFGSPTTLNYGTYIPIQLHSASISVGSRNLALQYSDDNANWTAWNAGGTVSTAAFNVGVVQSGVAGNATHRYWRAVLKSGGSDCTLTMQGATINWMNDAQTSLVWRILSPVVKDSGLLVKQYMSLTIPAGYILSTDNPCRGLVVYVQGNANIYSAIDMSQKAGLAPNGEIVPMIVTKKGIYNAKTSALLHMNSALTDAQGRTWTSGGAGQTWDTTNFKFGTASVKFDGTATAYMDTPASDDFGFVNDDFTIDCWIRTNSVTTTQNIFGASDASGASPVVRAYVDTDGRLHTQVTIPSINAANVRLDGKTSLSTGAWYHVALVKYGNSITLYVNGAADAPAAFSGPVNKCLYKFAIGRYGEQTANTFNGNIDEFRVVKGKAMYTANFTPPTAEYVFQSSYSDVKDTLAKFLQLSTVLQPLRGGEGGNGGYGGGVVGSDRSTGGIGGGGRINAGGYAGGGGGGTGENGGGNIGGAGGNIQYAELGGSTGAPSLAVRVPAGSSVPGGSGTCGGGGRGSMFSGAGGAYVYTAGMGGTCYGGGGGGSGGVADNVSANVTGGAAADGQYAGGFIAFIVGGNMTINAGGSLKADGGGGGNGGHAAGSTYTVGSGGGGGGAGGGVVAIYYKGTYVNSGSITVNGGVGGTGGTSAGSGEIGGTGMSGSSGTIYTQKL